MADEVMCATLHNHTLVREGDLVAGTRAIPLVISCSYREGGSAWLRGGSP
jgi:hypothetical protein